MRDADIVINLIGILYESGNNTFQRHPGDAPGRIAGRAKRRAPGASSRSRRSAPTPTRPPEYARSKAAGEQAVLEAFPEATILRPSIVFGPEDGFFNRFAAMARISGTAADRRRPHEFQPVYVGDVGRRHHEGAGGPRDPGQDL